MKLIWIVILFVIASILFILYKISRTMLFTSIGMKISKIKYEFGGNSIKFMKKFKPVYRMIGELFIIWLIFEWENSLIASTIAKLGGYIYETIKPLVNPLKEFFIYISPYGRSLLENETINKWMYVASMILFVVSVIYLLLILSQESGKLFMIGTYCIVVFVEWYIMLGLSFLVAQIPQEKQVLCACAEILGIALILLAGFGLLTEIEHSN